MLKALKIRGPFRGTSGYDHHVRAFTRELHAQGVAVELEDLPNWSAAKLPAELQDPWFETLNRPVDAAIVLHFSMPHQVVAEPGMFNVNFTMFEATRVHPEWIRANRQHDLVIVPTESSLKAWVASGMPAHRLRLCPLGVDPSLFTGAAEPLDLDTVRRVRFLNVSDVTPRKNLHWLIDVWMEATSREDDAVLILKVGCRSQAQRDQFAEQVRAAGQRLGKSLAEAAPLLFVNRVFSDAEMPRLYASATHYISVSHGEGWDLPMMQAAASGLRLIAPAHSAYATYLDPSIATLIESHEIPVEYGGDAATAELFQGACWWQPDRQAAIQAIRAAIEGRDSRLSSPRDRVVNEFTWERATKRLLSILEELHLLRDKLRLVAALQRNRTTPTASAHSETRMKHKLDAPGSHR